MLVETLACGPYGTNCYILAKEKGECLIVDAPPESYSPVMELCTEKGWQPQALLITHGHWDHMLDAHLFQKEQIPVLSHGDSRELMEHPESMAWMSPGGLEFIGVTPDRFLSEGPIQIGRFSFQILETPGHSLGSLSFYFPDSNDCFVGDLIFQQSVGRCDLPGGDMQVLSQSILQKIFTLKEKTILYPGHGPSTRVGYEKQHNPYIHPLRS